jgi:ABC-type bacteriocin/lantibiotic exporter with double-glycine peptidase domain
VHRVAIVLVLAGAACATGQARPFSPSRFDREPGWTAVRGVPLVLQRDRYDCGAAATSMVLAFWRRPETVAELRAESGVPKDRGLTAGWLRDHLRERGLAAYLVEGTVDDLAAELDAGHPVMVGVVRGKLAHYQVVIGLDRRRGVLVVMDSIGGWLEMPIATFERTWTPARKLTLVAFPDPDLG